jgi:hypothetical protein
MCIFTPLNGAVIGRKYFISKKITKKIRFHEEIRFHFVKVTPIYLKKLNVIDFLLDKKYNNVSQLDD